MTPHLSVKTLLDIDDSLDIFAQHGVGGIIGLFANAFFADPSIAALDEVSHIQGGWVSQNWYASTTNISCRFLKI